jgi:acylaminoacyl-peptidase
LFPAADWCVVESCGLDGHYDFDSVRPASEAAMLQMRRCSPIHHVHRVVAPTLLCLGAKDRRVPPSQGHEFYHVLRAQGVTTRCEYHIYISTLRLDCFFFF